jgi:prepilin-type N-terminal cleavage/methylation domain-containing protein
MKKEGFTIIETLVAIAVIVIVLSSFVGLTLLGQRGYQTAKLKYTAAKIAQEGLELAFNKKQNNILCVLDSLGGGPCSGMDWKNDLIGTWKVDATKRNQLKAGIPFTWYVPGTYLCINTAGPNEGMFSYPPCAGLNTVLPGNFDRKVEITDPNPPGGENIRIISTVYWKDRGVQKELILEEVVFGLQELILEEVVFGLP